MRSTTAMILLSVGVVGFLSGFALRGQSQEVPQGVHPQVVRTQDDGGIHYEPVLLNTYRIQFFERNKEIDAMSQLFDFDFDRDAGDHLTRMRVILRPEPAKWRPAPPGAQAGAQAGALPLTGWTVYEDLDGNSVFDVMTKIGPELDETYILVGYQWVRVGNRKAKWGNAPVAQGLETKDRYRFGPTGWARD